MLRLREYYLGCADANVQCWSVRWAMVKEGTPGKYQLRAVKPGSRRPLVEDHASRDAVDARKVALECAGYTVIIRVAETMRDFAPRGQRHKPPDLPP